ncbi:MAG: DsbA family protein [Chloroflexi bacterium]|jgi:protein-disulfide isomerase|nr:DsbA family protein [Chloroflexota bacterium]
MSIEETLPHTPEEEITEEVIPEPSPEAALEEEPSAPDENKTMTFKRSHVYAALLPLAFVIGLSVGYLFWGQEPAIVAAPEAANEAAAQAPAEAEPAPQEVRRYDVPEDDDPVWGPDDAPITIIEFSDYECPYCQKWHVQIWPLIQAAYPEQIRLVYRDFPLTNIHPNATPAASAANCAEEQDAYWEFSEMLFSAEQNLNVETYLQYAETLNLDMDAFTECVESGRHNAEIMADLEYAVNLGVSSTPTFFVNGIPVVGAQPFEVFQNIIEAEFAGEIP